MYVSRACDTCKRRKVKCDAAEPCANCMTSKLRCAYTIVPRKRGRAVQKRPPTNDSLATRTRPGRVEARIPPATHGLPVLASASPVRAPNPSLGPSLTVSYGAYESTSDPIRICINLAAHLEGILDPRYCIRGLANKCIDLWKAFIYPVTPTGHESTLRASVSLLLPTDSSELLGPTSNLMVGCPQLAYMKDFAMITALCALVTSTAPESLITPKGQLASAFLQASRAMLSSYESFDLEHPDSSSLIVRTWHASAMQNTTGKHGAACQVHLGAELLALRLRLYDEASVARYDAQEAQQLRSVFWLLHHSDKASAAFLSRIYILDEGLFDERMSVAEYGDLSIAPHLELDGHGLSLDKHIHAAFHEKRRMWLTATDLLKAIRRYKHHGVSSPHSQGPLSPIGLDCEAGVEASNIMQLSETYLQFTGFVGDMPPWLCLPEDSRQGLDPEATIYRERTRWAMRSNMMTSFHCLKLIILHECSTRSLHQIVGLDRSEASIGLRKIETAQDFLYELHNVPFEGFKMQGEPAVQRIRQVGGILLELVQNTPNEAIKFRAQGQFRQLLDYLAKLDSRVSDELE